MAEFRMPSLGADMDAGTLTEWRVAAGDRVQRGDVVAVVDTSKAEIEIEIFEDGEIERLLVAPGARVPVGAVLATVKSDVAAAPAPPAPVAVAAPSPPVAPQAAPAGNGAGARRARVSPLARRVAARLGIDPATIRGSGPGRAVTRADVERTAGARAAAAPDAPEPRRAAPPPAVAVPLPAPAPAPANGGPVDRRDAMRATTAALMARSKREIPHYHLQRTIDLHAAFAWLSDHNAVVTPAERVIPAALLLAAAARAARAVPVVNGFWSDGAFRPADRVHLGVAIAIRGGGLLAPALHDADRLAPIELMGALADLADRARGGALRASEMTDATITVTNLGDLGADLVHGVIHPPQVALVGFGAIRRRPWAVGDMLGVRPLVVASLAADHRVSDGMQGSRYLAKLDALLQRPEEI